MTIYYLLFEGFSGLELMFPAFILRKLESKTVGLTKGPIVSEENLRYYPDLILDELEPKAVSAFIIPGGSALQHLKDGSNLQKKLEEIHQENKIIASICGSPVLLANTTILANKRFTAGYQQDLPEHWQTNFECGTYISDEDVIIDQNIITAKGIAVVKFAVAIGEELGLFKNEEDKKSAYNLLKNIR